MHHVMANSGLSPLLFHVMGPLAVPAWKDCEVAIGQTGWGC